MMVVESVLPAILTEPVNIQQSYTQEGIAIPPVCSTKPMPFMEQTIELRFEMEEKPKQRKEKVMKASKKFKFNNLFNSLVLSLGLVTALPFEVPEAHFKN